MNFITRVLVTICMLAVNNLIDAMHMASQALPEKKIIEMREFARLERGKAFLNERKYGEAKKYFEEGAHSSNPSYAALSYVYLAQIYFFGWGVARDREKACKLCDEVLTALEREADLLEEKAWSGIVERHPEILPVIAWRQFWSTGGFSGTTLPMKKQDKERRAELYVVVKILRDAACDPNREYHCDEESNELPLLYAIRKGYNLMARFLINLGARLDRKDGVGRTLVSVALKHWNRDLATLLLQNQTPWNVMHTNVFMKEAELFAALLIGGRKVDESDAQGITPLHVAALTGDLRIFQTVLDAGADLAAVDKDGNTALHWAAAGADTVNIISLLLKRGADFNALSYSALKPLHLAFRYNGLLSVELILKNSSPLKLSEIRGEDSLDEIIDDTADQERAVALRSLAFEYLQRDDYEELFIDLGTMVDNDIREYIMALPQQSPLLYFTDENGNTLLHRAVLAQKKDMAYLLLEKGANPNVGNKERRTPLHYAWGDDELVECLLRAGANCRAIDEHGLTPLHNSLRTRRQVALLLDYGADIHALTNKGEPPLHMFLGSGKHNTAIVALLLERGARVDIIQGGYTALHLVCNGMTAKLLLEKGLKLDALSINHETPLQRALGEGNEAVVAALLAAGANPNQFFEQTIPPLFIALLGYQNGNLESLLKAGVNVHVRYEGNACLHKVFHVNHVDLLLSAGADINALNDEGMTPLHVAASAGSQNLITVLLARNADVTIRDKLGRLPRDLPRLEYIRKLFNT